MPTQLDPDTELAAEGSLLRKHNSVIQLSRLGIAIAGKYTPHLG